MKRGFVEKCPVGACVYDLIRDQSFRAVWLVLVLMNRERRIKGNSIIVERAVQVGMEKHNAGRNIRDESTLIKSMLRTELVNVRGWDEERKKTGRQRETRTNENFAYIRRTTVHYIIIFV